jgi:hypothetical protein
VKKQHLILLTAGIILAVIIINKSKKSGNYDIIKPGDKGNDVCGLQSAFSNLTGAKIYNMGAYDNNTLTMVRTLLKGSNALIDYDKGYVDRQFASDLFTIQNNAKNDLKTKI